MVEQRSPKPRAEGSNPSAPAIAVVAQSAEHFLGKEEVGSSNLLNSSKNPCRESDKDFLLYPAEPEIML